MDSLPEDTDLDRLLEEMESEPDPAEAREDEKLFDDLLESIDDDTVFNKLERYQPFPYQRDFHHALGQDTDRLASQRAIIGGNKTGKTYCAAFEVAMHLTGKYPDWWQGHRFEHPVQCLVAGPSSQVVRDVPQRELMGAPENMEMQGEGAIPRGDIVNTLRHPGVPNAYESVMVRHHPTGKQSRCFFRAYEQGKEKFQGFHSHFTWLDEEPPEAVFGQVIRSTFTTKGLIAMSFTPENGLTDLTSRFLNDTPKGCWCVQPTWDDVPLYEDEDYREQKLSEIPAHERELRTRGIPVMGSGLIFPILDEQISIEPFKIPDHWPRIVGIDFGWDHPFGAVAKAWDRETNTSYVYHVIRESKMIIPVAASAVKSMLGERLWMPIVWPMDGLHKDPRGGEALSDLFRQEGLNMLLRHFTNPPGPGQKEGDGGVSVEAGLLNMLTRMEQGLFKVFSSCPEWFDEKRSYHRRDGVVVKKRDDLMAADRYAEQSLRFSSVRPTYHAAPVTHKGVSNW